jgi:hypothetical protein
MHEISMKFSYFQVIVTILKGMHVYQNEACAMESTLTIGSNTKVVIDTERARDILENHAPNPFYSQQRFNNGVLLNNTFSLQTTILEGQGFYRGYRMHTRYGCIHDVSIALDLSHRNFVPGSMGTLIYRRGSTETYLSIPDLLQLKEVLNTMNEHKLSPQTTRDVRHSEPKLADIVENVDPWYMQDAHLYPPRRR